MRTVCPFCKILWPMNGHSINGASCSQRQVAALKKKIREYIDAHNALAAAGTTPERPVAAQRLGDAWIALTEVVK